MKAILEFNHPEDHFAFQHAVNGEKYYTILYNFKELLRQKLKYEDLSDERISVIEKLQDDFYQMVHDEGVIL